MPARALLYLNFGKMHFGAEIAKKRPGAKTFPGTKESAKIQDKNWLGQISVRGQIITNISENISGSAHDFAMAPSSGPRSIQRIRRRFGNHTGAKGQCYYCWSRDTLLAGIEKSPATP
jgi:hypothetical protein